MLSAARLAEKLPNNFLKDLERLCRTGKAFPSIERDTSITKSKQLELAIPINKISSLSSGEFVGMVADNPDQKIELKAFCAEVINDHEALEEEQSVYKGLPMISNVSQKEILDNYLQIKKDIQVFSRQRLNECWIRRSWRI